MGGGYDPRYSIAPHLVVVALNLFAIAKFVALNLFALIFVFSVLLSYSFCYSNYCNSNSCRSLMLLNVLAKSNNNLFAIAFKKERVLNWLAWVEGTIQGTLFSIAPHFLVSVLCFIFDGFCDSNSCRSFTLLKALAKSNGNLFAIAFKKERVLNWLAWVEGMIQGTLLLLI